MSTTAVIIIVSVVAFACVGLLLASMILFIKGKLVSNAPCKININNNEELSFETAGGSVLLNVLLSKGYGIPCPCGGKATCLQCRIRLVEGEAEPLETEKGTFSPRELEGGWRLSCQCKIKNDLSIKLSDAQCSSNELTAIVVGNQNVATFIKELTVSLAEGTNVEYIPGDYMQVHVPRFQTNTNTWLTTIDPEYREAWQHYQMFDQDIDCNHIDENTIRAYSMASYPGEKKVLKFNVRIATPPIRGNTIDKKIPWGICSSYLFSLKEGDTVHLSGPFGESHMIDSRQDIYFLIGGAGSSFGRSHILDLFYTRQTQRKVALWYGARSLRENIYEEDFRRLEETYDNFSYHLVLSEPLEEDFANTGWPKDDPTKTNFLFKAFEIGVLSKLDNPEDALYYVCGPPMHNKSVMDLLDRYGVEDTNIVLDDFGS